MFAHHVGPLSGADSEADMCSVCVYVHLEHSYVEYCILMGQGVVYKSHINHETWPISARGTYKPRRPSPHVQCPYIATT